MKPDKIKPNRSLVIFTIALFSVILLFIGVKNKPLFLFDI